MQPLFLSAMEPVDSDVDLGDPVQRRELRRQHGMVFVVIAVGGIIGSVARYQLGIIWRTTAPAFPWTTLLINVTGSFVLGVLMVAISARGQLGPLIRQFVGTGVLVGYTTFSTFTVDVVLLLRADRPAVAALYLFGTLFGALLATVAGMALARATMGERVTTEGGTHPVGRDNGKIGTGIQLIADDRISVGGCRCSDRRSTAISRRSHRAEPPAWRVPVGRADRECRRQRAVRCADGCPARRSVEPARPTGRHRLLRCVHHLLDVLLRNGPAVGVDSTLGRARQRSGRHRSWTAGRGFRILRHLDGGRLTSWRDDDSKRQA